jgi:hypothetical protein
MFEETVTFFIRVDWHFLHQWSFQRLHNDLCDGRNLKDKDEEISCKTSQEEALQVGPFIIITSNIAS